MKWHTARAIYGDQWLVIEALRARSLAGRRFVDDLAVVDVLGDARRAMERYLTLHRHAPQRELYVVHSRRERLVIEERRWLGLRPLSRTAKP